MTGNLGQTVLGGAGSSLTIDQFNATSVTNNLGVDVPAGASLWVGGMIGSLGNLTLEGTGSTLYIEGNSLTNNLGVSVPAGASLSVVGLAGNLGNVCAGRYGRQSTSRVRTTLRTIWASAYPPAQRYRSRDSPGIWGTSPSVVVEQCAAISGINLTNNQGISVPLGATMTVNGLSGNIGSVTLAGAGSSLTLDKITGTGLTNNLGLSVPAARASRCIH